NERVRPPPHPGGLRPLTPVHTAAAADRRAVPLACRRRMNYNSRRTVPGARRPCPLGSWAGEVLCLAAEPHRPLCCTSLQERVAPRGGRERGLWGGAPGPFPVNPQGVPPNP